MNTVDTRFAIRGAEKPPNNIVVVRVDSSTFGVINQQWPFPRATEARVLSRIAAEHPAAIAFDIVFSDPSQLGQKDDLAFLTAIGNTNVPMVFSFQETDSRGDVRLLGLGQSQSNLRAAGLQPASTLDPFDPGGYIRRMFYSINHLTTFPIVTAEAATGKRVRPFAGSKWINYLGPTGAFKSISFGNVYLGDVPPDFFRGKIVVIGATAPSLLDLHPTSTDSQMSGAEIEANAIETVLHGFPLSAAPGWVNLILIVLLGAAVPAASLRVRPVVSIAIAIFLGAVFAIAAQLAFDAGWIVSFAYPLGALILGAVASLAVLYVIEAIERERVHSLFARFVPANVVDQVLARTDENLRLGAMEVECTVMFSDLRGFTTFSEGQAPADVLAVVNAYLEVMTDAILAAGGTLITYIGDGIMALFGAPLEQPDHADRALAAACEMLGPRLARFNEWMSAESYESTFRMGVGLHSGPVMAGNVGSNDRLSYTAIGDTVNTASRLEGLTKEAGCGLLLSSTTRMCLTRMPEDLIFVGELDVRGRAGRIPVWSVAGAQSPDSPSPVATAAGGPPPASGVLADSPGGRPRSV